MYSFDVGSCWNEGVVRLHQHPEKLPGHALEIMGPLEHRDILGQVLLVHPAKRAQDVAQPRPNAFNGIAVHLGAAVFVGVAGPLPIGVVDAPARPPRRLDLVASTLS